MRAAAAPASACSAQRTAARRAATVAGLGKARSSAPAASTSEPCMPSTRANCERSPSSDTAAHAYVYRNMPEVGGVVHTHSTYATAWAARGEAIFRRKALECLKCHAIAGAGGQVGPSLESVGAGAPTNSSPVSWGPAKTIVAASGDFGVTIGFIVPNKPGADGKLPPGQPFFTIWKRDSPSGKWLYIAE